MKLSRLLILGYFSCAFLLSGNTNDPYCCSLPEGDTDNCANTCKCSTYRNEDPCKCNASSSASGSASGNSIKFDVGFTACRDGSRSVQGVLGFEHEEPNLLMFTPQGLKFSSPVAAFLAKEVDYQHSEAEGPSSETTLTVTDHTGVSIAYRKAYRLEKIDTNGNETNRFVGWEPIDESARSSYFLAPLDASGDFTEAEEPVYMTFYNNIQKTYIIFDYASGEPIKAVDKYGRISTFDDIDILRIQGVIAGIAYPEGLITIVPLDSDHEYEIRFYDTGEFTYNATAGEYVPNENTGPSKRFNIRNPSGDTQDIDETIITRYWHGRITQWQFEYTNNGGWEVRIGEVVSDTFNLLRREVVSSTESQSGHTKTDVKKVYDGSGKLLSQRLEIQELTDKGFKPVEVAEDPLGANLVTRYGYYEEGDHAGELKFKEYPDGRWEMYDYDSKDRVVLKAESWLDVPLNENSTASAMASLAKSTVYEYSPVDALDSGDREKDSPRTISKYVKGALVGTTWHAYYVANGQYYEVTERSSSQNTTPYGSPSNLRSETIRFAPVLLTQDVLSTSPSAGRVKQSIREDGSITEYSYLTNGNDQFVVTETNLHADAPSGVAYKTTRREKTYDASANLIRDEMFVLTDVANETYQGIYYLTHAYDADGNRTETRRFDGLPEPDGRLIYDATYAHGKAVSVTDEAGHVVKTAYDVLDRKQIEIAVGSAAAGVADIARLFGYSTAATGCGCTASKTLIIPQEVFNFRLANGAIDTFLLGDPLIFDALLADPNTSLSISETDRVKRPTRTVDVNGLETTHDYSNGGRVTTETNPDGSTRITTNYLDGRVKSITGTGVIPQYFTYGVGTNGSIWTRIDTADATYAGLEDISSATDLRYRKTTSDIAGRLIKEESPAYAGSIYTVQYAYDAYGRLQSQSRSGQAETLYEYDATGALFRSGLNVDGTVDADGKGELNVNSTDRITESTRSYTYEGGAWFDVTTTEVYPTATAVTVSTQKRRLSGFSGALVSESISVNIHGKKTTRIVEIAPANKTVTRTVVVPGSGTPAKTVTINGYLKEQNSTTVAAATTYGYDGLGRRISIQDPRHTNDTEINYYTGTRQVFTQTDAAGNTTSFAYYANGETGAGQVKSVTDALLQKSYYAYDRFGRQTQTWGETDYPQAYSYNTYGELATLTTWRDADGDIDFSTSAWPQWDDPNDNTADPVDVGGNHLQASTTAWTYDVATGLLTRKEYADGNGTDYTYDSTNRLSVRTWARDGGLDTTYSYSATTGELTGIDYEDVNTADITYTYDRLGRQESVTDATGSRTFDYDAVTLQLATENLATTFYDDHTLERSYDSLGRYSGYTLKDSASSAISAVNYAYASEGRLSTITDGTDTFTYGYEANSNLLASLTAPQHNVAYTYEPNRNLMTVIDNRAGSTGVSPVSTYTYGHDELGRRITRQQSGSAIATTNTDTFDYNTRSEVISSINSAETTAAEWNPSYTYDQIGNRSGNTVDINGTTSYVADELNQYDSVGGVMWDDPDNNKGYDLDGNFLGDGNWVYTWNNENRLASATNGTVTIDFTYDYQGRLVKKDDGTNVEVFVYDGWNRIATFTPQVSSLSLQVSYLWGLDLSGSIQGAGGVGGLLKEGDNYPLYDANGNIMQKLDGTGVVVMNVEYDPFGNVIALKDANGIVDSNLEFVGEYGISTKPLIDDLDWYYYGFRYYDPTTGRWPSRDPIGELGHKKTAKTSEALLFEAEIKNELSAVTASLINNSNRLSQLSSGSIGELFLIQQINFEIDDDLNYYYYLSDLIANDSVVDVVLMEGELLYTFVANDGINRWDYLGLSLSPYALNTISNRGGSGYLSNISGGGKPYVPTCKEKCFQNFMDNAVTGGLVGAAAQGLNKTNTSAKAGRAKLGNGGPSGKYSSYTRHYGTKIGGRGSRLANIGKGLGRLSTKAAGIIGALVGAAASSPELKCCLEKCN